MSEPGYCNSDNMDDCGRCERDENERQCRALCHTTGNFCRRFRSQNNEYCEQHRPGVSVHLGPHLPPDLSRIVMSYVVPSRTMTIMSYMASVKYERPIMMLFGQEYLFSEDDLGDRDGQRNYSLFDRDATILKNILYYFLKERNYLIDRANPFHDIISVTDNRSLYVAHSESVGCACKDLQQYEKVAKPTQFSIGLENVNYIYLCTQRGTTLDFSKIRKEHLAWEDSRARKVFIDSRLSRH
jgi:hypothetical protein